MYHTLMSPREERALARLWQDWSQDKPYTNQTIASFFFEVTREHVKFAHLNAFEVFDVVTNVTEPNREAQPEFLQQESSQPDSLQPDSLQPNSGQTQSSRPRVRPVRAARRSA